MGRRPFDGAAVQSLLDRLQIIGVEALGEAAYAEIALPAVALLHRQGGVSLDRLAAAMRDVGIDVSRSTLRRDIAAVPTGAGGVQSVPSATVKPAAAPVATTTTPPTTSPAPPTTAAPDAEDWINSPPPSTPPSDKSDARMTVAGRAFQDALARAAARRAAAEGARP